MPRLTRSSMSVKTIELEYKVVKFTHQHIARYQLVAAKTYVPCLSASVYEVAYSMGNRRYKASIRTILYHVAFLFTWEKVSGVNIERMLLEGKGLDFICVRKFANWLEKIISPPVNGTQVNKYVSKILQSCSAFSIWFVENFTPLFSAGLEVNISYISLIESHKKVWSSVMVGGKKDHIAHDMTDGELEKIEEFLILRLSCANVSRGLNLRNYIMWRLVRRFGLRIGELLALRLEDIDLTGSYPFLEIIRIEDRGAGYFDPRTPNNPLVKTYGRRLYFGPDDEGIITAVEEYVDDHRVKRKIEGGGFTTYLEHEFLLVSHGNASLGSPLSSSAANKIARMISNECVETFHWHLVRHAVFNRLYEAASLLVDNSTEIDHIVYMGGWSNPSSLKSYVRRAIRDNARRELMRVNIEGVNSGH